MWSSGVKQKQIAGVVGSRGGVVLLLGPRLSRIFNGFDVTIFSDQGFFRLETGQVFKVGCLILESASLDSPGIIAWPIYSPIPVRRNSWTARVFLGDIWHRMKQFEWRSSDPATFLHSYYVVLGKSSQNPTKSAET